MPKTTVRYMGVDIDIEVTDEQLQEMSRRVSGTIEVNVSDLNATMRTNRLEYYGSLRRQDSARESMDSFNSVMSKKDLNKMAFVSRYEASFRMGVEATIKWLLEGCQGDIWEYGNDNYIKDMKKQYYGNINGRWL